MPKPKIAVSWFEAHDWSRWCELDPMFDTSRARWLAKMDATLPELERRGVTVVKMPLDLDLFAAWAKASGQGTGQAGRGMYAAWLLMQSGGTH
jgi:hypothetical protein